MKPRNNPLAKVLPVCGTSLLLVTAARAADATWTGGVGGTGTDLNAGANWSTSSTPTGSGDTATWDGSAPGNLNLIWSNSFGNSPGGTNFNIASGQTGSLAIDGSAANMQIGNITIASGAGAFTLGDGTGTAPMVWRNPGGNAINTLTNNSSNTATFGADLVMNSGGGVVDRNLVFGGTGNWRVDGTWQLGGAGSLVIIKNGAGTLTVANANTGATTIPYTINGGALDFNGGTQTTGAIHLAAGGTEVRNGTIAPSAINLTATSGVSLVSANIAGATNVNVNAGGGTLALSGNNTFSGNVNLASNGTVAIDGGTSTGIGSITYNSFGTTFNMNAGSFQSAGVTSNGNSDFRNFNLNGGTLQSNSDIFTASAAVAVNFNGGTLRVGNAGGIALYDANNSIEVNAGGATIDTTLGNLSVGQNNANANAPRFNGNAGGTITVTGGNTINSGVTNTGLLSLAGGSTWNINGTASSTGGLSGTSGTVTNTAAAQTLTLNVTSGSQTFGGAISGGANLALIKSGAETQILTGASTYSGTTTINAGRLQLGDGTTTGSLNPASAITNNGTFAIHRSNAAAQGTDFGTIVGGTGGVALTGGGTFTFNTANAYSGNTSVEGATAHITTGGTLGSGTISLGAFGTLSLSGGVTLANPVTASGLSNITSAGNNTLSSGVTFGTVGSLNTAIDSTSGTLTLGGTSSTTLGLGRNFVFGGAGDIDISGAMQDGSSAVSVTKNGAGTLHISGTSTYSGTTAVNAGTLYISGALTQSNVIVSSVGTIGAGDASGALGGNLHLDSGALLDVSLGVLTIADTATLSFGGFGFANLIGFDVETASVGTHTLIDGGFTLDPANISNFGAANAFTRLDGKLAYFEAGSLNVVVIPEPHAVWLGGIGLFALFRRRVR